MRIKKQIAKMVDVKFDVVCVGKLNAVVSAVASGIPGSKSILVFIIKDLKLFQYHEHILNSYSGKKINFNLSKRLSPCQSVPFDFPNKIHSKALESQSKTTR